MEDKLRENPLGSQMHRELTEICSHMLVYENPCTYSSINNIWYSYIFLINSQYNLFLLLSDPLLPLDPQERFKKGGNKSLGAIRPTNVKLMGVCSPTSSHSQALNINPTLLGNALFILWLSFSLVQFQNYFAVVIYAIVIKSNPTCIWPNL